MYTTDLSVSNLGVCVCTCLGRINTKQSCIVCVCVCVCSLLLGNPNLKDPYLLAQVV